MLWSIDRAATVTSAADATLVVRVQGCFVVDRDLFSCVDVAQGAEENVIVQDLHERVRTARVIDVMRSVSAATPVKTPAVIHLANTQHTPVRATPRFGVRNLLAGVLGDLVSLFKGYGSEAAFAVY